MAMKIFKPNTPGQRNSSIVNYRGVLDKVKPMKNKLSSLKRSGGRNNLGRITTRHRGGGAARKYRMIDFKRSKRDVVATVEYIEYDPNRTAFIARLKYVDGARDYILAPSGLKKGMQVIASNEGADVKPGNAMPLSKVPFGTVLHSVELKPGKGAQLGRSAGASIQLLGRVDGYAQLKLPSGETRRVQESCYATVGEVGNNEHMNRKIGKAGRKRWMGFRPTVRGVAMNPVDHPHGGGEGRTSGGRHPVSPWATPTKGYKTRKNKRTDKDIIRRRKKKK